MHMHIGRLLEATTVIFWWCAGDSLSHCYYHRHRQQPCTAACVKQVRLERCIAGGHASHDALIRDEGTVDRFVRVARDSLLPPTRPRPAILFVFHTLAARIHLLAPGWSSNGSAGALPPPSAPPRAPVPRQVPVPAVALVVSSDAIVPRLGPIGWLIWASGLSAEAAARRRAGRRRWRWRRLRRTRWRRTSSSILPSSWTSPMEVIESSCRLLGSWL
jgi:hypothetical protein